jgi:hypothetical protein
MKQEAQVHMLPTEDKSSLFKRNHLALMYAYEKQLLYIESKTMIPKDGKYQHLYITVSQEREPIKEGDWYIGEDNVIYNLVTTVNFNGRKIIATTDEKLKTEQVSIDKKSGKMDWAIVPQVQRSFIKEYCDKGGIDKVMVEYKLDVELGVKNIESKGKISPWKLKLNPDNTIIITLLEECEHPYKRLHWVDNTVYCNKCKTTLKKK